MQLNCANAAASNKRLKEFALVTPFPAAPEICVEIMSPANTWAEMHMNAGLYLEAGALEVWVIAMNGKRKTIKPST
ncbi:MAG: Uma2 family endonuclease [Burkholderiaceae bacterium]